MRSGANALEEAFCRAYTCTEAIEKFLARSLAPLNEPGTYALPGEKKMTVAIDSERQVAWCNDSNVPRNAFNLVRHYRFGELDTSVKDGTATKRLPSYKAMLKLCREDVAVRKNLIHGIGTHETNDSDDWELKLTLNDNNQIEKTGQNIKLILLNDSKLSKVRFDRFTKRDITQCPDFCNERDNRIDDESVGKICLYLENQYGLQLSQPRILEMLKTTSKERGFNPVQNFIMSDSWDYVERIDTVVIRYLGAEDTPLTRAQTRKWMIGAVARTFGPGCKFDHIILNGKKGIREVCEYLKANPDFLEVRCFMPATDAGTRLFAAINDAVKGTAINRSDLYRGYGSLLGRYAPKVPESYRKRKEAQRAQFVKADERIVRQSEPKPKVTHTPTLGEKKSAVIDRKDGGLKL